MSKKEKDFNFFVSGNCAMFHTIKATSYDEAEKIIADEFSSGKLLELLKKTEMEVSFEPEETEHEIEIKRVKVSDSEEENDKEEDE